MTKDSTEVRNPDAEGQVQQGPARKPSSAGAKVTVYCNLPHGLRIHADRMTETREVVMGGGYRDVKVAEKIEGSDTLINGTAVPRDAAGQAMRTPPIMVGQYAVTRGVDADVWNSWHTANKQSPMVRNRCIFAYPEGQESKGEGEAAENAKRRTGMEAFAQEGDPRAPRPASGNMSRVTRDTDTRSNVS